ncbi:hypothetical protein ACFPZD_08155 [Dyella tabacisoli]|uniref:hypothetical protein n=1 Tax=Dyella tabacisoli TaxID=2282381 RepID=UPI0013B3CC8F|nr:hypothetical protein [Dyella tabacisoli]
MSEKRFYTERALHGLSGLVLYYIVVVGLMLVIRGARDSYAYEICLGVASIGIGGAQWQILKYFGRKK